MELSTFDASLQLTLAGWVRARGLSTYLIVFLGGQGLGALLWGAVGSLVGVTSALLAATGLLLLQRPHLALVATANRETGPDHQRPGRSQPWISPVGDSAGPVVVEVGYTVTAARPSSSAPPVRSACPAVEPGRRARPVYRDAADRTSYVELFSVPTWASTCASITSG